MIWFAGSWSYETFGQFNARVVRAGQGKRVSIVTLKSDTGLDAAIAAVIAAKAADARLFGTRLPRHGGPPRRAR